MRIDRLELINVRNHENLSVELADETIFTGDNGSGKTTALEAIYLLFAMKGFKKQSLSAVVSFNKPFMVINAFITANSYESVYKLAYDGKKVITSDGVSLESIADHIYNYPIACHSPETPGILCRDQSERRGFIDRYIFYSDKNHMDNMRLYNRLIIQKTAAFEQDYVDNTYLDILNEEIIRLSSIISEKRKKFIGIINIFLENIYKDATIKIEPVFISYKTNINDKDILLKESSKGRCDYGIHRDKIDMCLDSKIIEKFSSFGQKKTFALLSVLGALKHIEQVRKIGIITLLDDFEAGLDKERAELLKENFSSGRQTIYSGVENLRLGFKNTIFLQG